MKIERKETEFQPITITIETQDELDQLISMAEHCNFLNIAGDSDISQIIWDKFEYDRVKEYYNPKGIDLSLKE